MLAQRIPPGYLLRLETGEEIMETLRAFSRAEALPAAWLSGLGAADRMRVGVFDPSRKAYRHSDHQGLIEILSLNGNLAWRGDEPILHVHVSAAEATAGAFGGHLVSGWVIPTVEIFLTPLPEPVARVLDDRSGLPLLNLPRYPLPSKG